MDILLKHIEVLGEKVAREVADGLLDLSKSFDKKIFNIVKKTFMAGYKQGMRNAASLTEIKLLDGPENNVVRAEAAWHIREMIGEQDGSAKK